MDRTIQDLKPNRVQSADDRAVDNFAQAMKAKMDAARKKGRTGWNDPKRCRADVLADLIIGHMSKKNAGNFEDIANLCMMLHQRGDDPSVLAAALDEHDEKVHVRAWENGYLNGREDTLSEVAQQERDLSPGLEWAIARCEALQKQGFTHSRNDVLVKNFRNCISALKSDVAAIERGES